MLVCDLEDFSLWCQTVDSSMVASFGERFLATASLLVDLLGGSFLKSTGDGFIAIWDQPADATPDEGSKPKHVDDAWTDVQRAGTAAALLQILVRLGFAFQWPTPRALRSAIHVGVLHRLAFHPLKGGGRIDYVGEALNAACRLQKLGEGLLCVIYSEHAARLLATSGKYLTIELPIDEEVDLKSVQWLAKRVYAQPTAMVLDKIRDSRRIDETDYQAFVEKYCKVAREASEESMYHLLSTIYAVAHRHEASVLNNIFPAWLRKLHQYAQLQLRDPFVQFNYSLLGEPGEVLESAYKRFRNDYNAADAPSWEEVQRLFLEDSESPNDEEVTKLLHAVFGLEPRSNRNGG